ncbi:MAG: pentapeptide repeat-containing protein, partial [Myxococcales bacterium]|nr:pentapeptide repeat-containing protein [Myxococcales bacterium]
GADFTGADLRRALIPNSTLCGATFVKADLRGADLGRSELSRVDLTGADLRNTGLVMTTLRDAELTSARHGPRTQWPSQLSAREIERRTSVRDDVGIEASQV